MVHFTVVCLVTWPLSIQQYSGHMYRLLVMGSVLHYPASRVSFDLPRKIGKREETLLTASTIPIEHASKSNVTEPWVASLSK